MNLQFLTGSLAGKIIKCDLDNVSVGSHADNDLCIPDAGVSGIHASFEKSNDQWLLHDIDSTNGVFINGQKISQKVTLKNSEILKLGFTEIKFISGHDPKPVEAKTSDSGISKKGQKNTAPKIKKVQHKKRSIKRTRKQKPNYIIPLMVVAAISACSLIIFIINASAQNRKETYEENSASVVRDKKITKKIPTKKRKAKAVDSQKNMVLPKAVDSQKNMVLPKVLESHQKNIAPFKPRILPVRSYLFTNIKPYNPLTKENEIEVEDQQEIKENAPADPAKIRTSLRPKDLDFNNLDDEIKTYLKHLNEDSREIESLRLYYIKAIRKVLISCLKEENYKGIVYIGESAVTGEVFSDDNGNLSLKVSPTKIHKVSWDKLDIKQYIYFLSYFAYMKGEELKHGNQSHRAFKAIAEFYFASSLLSDWYGFRSVAQNYAQKAITLDPELLNKELITFE